VTGPFPVLVLSPGRSGSSTVAKWLIDLGVNMGSRFKAADEINPNGYWEDLDWRDLNDAFATRAVIPKDWYERLAHSFIRERRNRFGPGGAWGAKDPRFCDVLSILRDCFTDEWLTWRFIRLHRDPGDVAASITRCFGFPHEEAMRVIRLRASLLDEALVGQTVLDIQFVDIVSGEARDIIREWL
jgi:hypothetical protein